MISDGLRSAFSWGLRAAGLAVLSATAVGCGCDGGTEVRDAGPDAVELDAPASPDAFVPPDAWPRCGDGIAEGGEACDDGNRRAEDGCSPACALECGDGRVGGEERCDTGIEAGRPGACPTSCDDGRVCTTDTLLGAGCSAECASTEITLPRDGDGCCPTGASSLGDADCPVVCGNGLLEEDELCDTAIAPTEAGSCPLACDDGAVCTSDALLEGGTCAARCTATEILEARAGDGCCPRGATVETDADCSPLCGDGVWTSASGELCDVAVAPGALGACPISCDDMAVCTRDVLVAAGTCTASCTYSLLPPIGGDGCCPPGATIANDDDCPVRCGDGVRSPGEACDDGNAITDDGCSPMCARTPRSFRFTSLSVQDPRLFTREGLDVTPEVNTVMRNAIFTDMIGPMGRVPDGYLDLSIVLRFEPLDQSAPTTMGSVDLTSCTVPIGASRCTSRAPLPVVLTNRDVGECLGPMPGTIPPERVVNAPSGPCFVSTPLDEFVLDLDAVAIRFRQAQIAGQYVGDPASRIVTGLLRAFLPESEARMTRLGTSDTLSTVLRASDLDTLDGAPGWWFYLAFAAEPVSDL
jgi:cysteine-rich repeat protein